jgi:aspartate/methionine/tyrosine aminotransferase
MPLIVRLVREFGVALIPGTTFGLEQGCHLRLAYGALDKQSVADGIGRLARGLTEIIPG